MKIYKKTESGQRAFKERSSDFVARQRAAYILIDGRRAMTSVIEATAGMGITTADFEHLLKCGYIELAEGSPAGATPSPPPAPPPASPAWAAVTAPSALQGPDLTAAASPPSKSMAVPQAPAPLGAPASPASTQVMYVRAYPIATQLVGSLGLRGFRLNLAVESASGYEQLVALLPRIREAVGVERCAPLDEALRP